MAHLNRGSILLLSKPCSLWHVPKSQK